MQDWSRDFSQEFPDTKNSFFTVSVGSSEDFWPSSKAFEYQKGKVVVRTFSAELSYGKLPYRKLLKVSMK